MIKKAKGNRQQAKTKSDKFVFLQNSGAFGLVFCATFLICIFYAVSFAQMVDKKPKTADVALKVTQINETNIAEILKAQGKPLLVNFWATWCVPCREEFPDLVEIAGEYKGKIDVITISLDDLAEINRDVPKFLSEMKATMPTYLLYTNKESEVISSVSKDWQGGLPFSVLYNAKGEIVHTKQGKIEPEVVKAKINELISQTDAKLPDFDFQFNQKNSIEYEKGIRDAKEDIAQGKYVIKTFGFGSAGSDESRQKTKNESGIEYQNFGCVVSNEQVEYIKGYNKISKAAIKQKFYSEKYELLNFSKNE